jgi:hypothetical protein
MQQPQEKIKPTADQLGNIKDTYSNMGLVLKLSFVIAVMSNLQGSSIFHNMETII